MLNFLQPTEQKRVKGQTIPKQEHLRLLDQFQDRGITIKKLNDLQRKQNEKIKRQREAIRNLKQELFSVRVGMENLRSMLARQGSR